MNPRERKLLMVIGSVVGAVVLYQGVKYFFVTPIKEAEEKIATLTTDTHRLENVIQSRERLAKRWAALVGRTLSYDSTVVVDRFGQDLKAITKRHQVTVTGVGSA